VSIDQAQLSVDLAHQDGRKRILLSPSPGLAHPVELGPFEEPVVRPQLADLHRSSDRSCHGSSADPVESRNRAAAQFFLQQNHIPLPALLTDNSQSGRMGVRGLPTTILIDQHGKVLSSHIGMQDWQNTAWTNQLLALFTSEHVQKTVTPVEIAHTGHN